VLVGGPGRAPNEVGGPPIIIPGRAALPAGIPPKEVETGGPPFCGAAIGGLPPKVVGAAGLGAAPNGLLPPVGAPKVAGGRALTGPVPPLAANGLLAAISAENHYTEMLEPFRFSHVVRA